MKSTNDDMAEKTNYSEEEIDNSYEKTKRN
jgi:hypothetical protein